ncbi:caspase family protein [Mucilaginibacter lappiensis]|uniref:caspase family protein n=1 Tax=Mucilaginibacter lappiensis TaxID=354630 RepID=UPI003D1F4A33
MAETRGALLVGIDHYGFPTSLTGCVADAEKFADLLAWHEDGTKNFDTYLHISTDAKKITRPFLKKKIEELFNVDGDIALFYFSGHGTENNLGGFLVTQDAEKWDEGVSLRDVLELANNSKSKETIIILDSCNSGHLGNLPAVNNQAVLRQGISILTASRMDQKAYESAGNGVFSSLLMEGLQGGAADILGKVTSASLYSYAEQALGFLEQRPLFKSHVAKLIDIRKCSPQVPLKVLRKLNTYFPEQNADYQLDPSHERTVEGYDKAKVIIFEDLQKCRATGLVVPVGFDHMYDAAIASGICRLTAQGRYYWYLAKSNRL